MKIAAPMLPILASVYWSQMALAQTAEVFIIGVGHISCGKWLEQPSTDFEVSTWIVGAWTGMNFANDGNHVVGSYSDAFGLVGEVRRICRERPSAPIASATFQAFRQMAQDQ